jgi:hypothetical protein
MLLKREAAAAKHREAIDYRKDFRLYPLGSFKKKNDPFKKGSF